MYESVVESEGDRLAKELGYIVRKVKWIGRKNAPDKLYSRKDTGPFLVEYKRPGKEPTPGQSTEIETFIRHGFTVYVVHSVREIREILYRERP